MNHHQKGSVATPILTIIALLIIAGGIYYFSTKSSTSPGASTATTSTPLQNPNPTPTPATPTTATSTLSTYDNFGIAFQYPSAWGIPQESFYSNGLGSVSFENSTTSQPFSVLTTQDVNPLGTGPLNETFDQMIARFRTNDQEIYQQKDISADGVQGVELFYDSALSGQPYHVEAYFPLQNGFYISFGADYGAVSQSTFDAIISTVKWDTTTAVKADPATGLATYSNNGIQFQYPVKLNTDYASLNIQTSDEKVDNSKLDSNGCYPGQASEETGRSVPATVMAINSIKFCYSTGGDVGAGQAYTDYTYMTIHNGNAYTIVYSVHTSNGCGAYQNSPDLNSPENQKYNECLADQKNFGTLVVAPIQQSISSFIFTN